MKKDYIIVYVIFHKILQFFSNLYINTFFFSFIIS